VNAGAPCAKDEYELALRKLVKRKAAGKRPPPGEDTGKVINLMEALRRSVQGGHVGGGRAQGSAKKKPARRQLPQNGRNQSGNSRFCKTFSLARAW
jgi:non-homologous end joining protein Ku